MGFIINTIIILVAKNNNPEIEFNLALFASFLYLLSLNDAI